MPPMLPFDSGGAGGKHSICMENCAVFIPFRKRGQGTGRHRVYNAGTFDSIWGITVNNARMLYKEEIL